MTTLNISARNYQIFVNLPNEGVEAGLDVTQYCTGDSGGFLTVTINPYDESGLFQVTGQLILDIPAYDPAFDIWENPGRWSVGNYVWIKVAAVNGTLYPLPVNRLYITRKPRQPMPGSWSLEIELGDLFTLYDAKQPTQIPSDIRRTRRSALELMLSQIDATLIGDIYNVDEGYFTFSTDESIVSQVGELALGGFSGLYQDKDGNIRPIRINYTPEWRLFKHTIGVDDAAEPEAISNAARPADEISVTTEELQSDDAVDEGKYRGFTRTVESMAIAAIDYNSTSTSEVTALIRTERWQWLTSFRYQQWVDEQRARGLTVPESLYEFLESQGRSIVYPGPTVMINAFSSYEEKIFESSSEGRLLTHTITTYKTRGELFADFYQKNLQPTASIPNLLGFTTAEEIQTTYEYKKFDTGASGEDSKGQVRKIKTVIKRPRGVVAAAANNWITQGVGGPTLAADPDLLIVAEIQIQTWRKRSKDEWEYRNQIFRAGQVRSGTLKKFSIPIKVKGEVIISRNGDIQPPAAERRPSREELARPSNTLRNTAIVKAKLDRVKRRDRKLRIKNLKQTGAATVAELLTKLEGYREEGWRITTTFRDEWFWFKPFVRIDLQYNNRIYYGIADVVVFTLASNQSIVTADCMKIGRSTEVAASTVYPYQSLPSMAVQPNPDPFGTIPIGGALPDPVGTPAEDDPNPELNFEEPIVPTVQVLPLLFGGGRGGASISVVPWDVTILPPVEITAQGRGDAVFNVISDPPAEGLFAEWPLNSATWEDVVGSNDLVEVGTGADLLFDSGLSANVAAFPTAPDLNYLHVASGAPFTSRSASSNRTWEITFDFWIPETPDPFGDREGKRLIKLGNEFEFYFFVGLLWVTIWDFEELSQRIGAPIGPDNGTPAIDLPSETWHSVVVRYDAATYKLTATLNGIATFPGSHPYDAPPFPLPEATTGAFEVGRNCIPGTRIKNIKYYLEDVVPNP